MPVPATKHQKVKIMPYKGEIASGESLIWLENSQALKDFNGTILHQEQANLPHPSTTAVPRGQWLPKRVIAIDGSNITQRVNNGYPGAEAGLLMVSVVAIKLDMLLNIDPKKIPRPSIFHDMERAQTLEVAISGIGIVRKGVENDDPLDFFRWGVYDALKGSIANNHETLLETLHAITKDHDKTKFECPIQGCEKIYQRGDGEYTCDCEKKGKLFETDILRLHEYFDGVRSSEEAHSRLRSVLEILVLLNILRFFAEKEPRYFADCIFVLDGPLAIFGTPASILRPIRKELKRLNKIARHAINDDIAIFGVEKTGAFLEHLEQIDYNNEKGPRTNYPDESVLLLEDSYIRKNIKPGKTEKPFGTDTHFGRTVLYKTNKGEHVVLNTAMLNEAAEDFEDTSIQCYPRLSHILNVMDNLATYLYRDGFIPLIRAHANAAIPLKRGGDIIKNLMKD